MRKHLLESPAGIRADQLAERARRTFSRRRVLVEAMLLGGMLLVSSWLVRP
jgi:hypothetical protein